MNNKVTLNPNVYDLPMPVTLLGTAINNKPNFMALGWLTRVNASPPMIGIGVGRTHLSYQSIIENKSFSINYPDVSMMKVTDYCGLYSGKNKDKSNLFNVFYGENETAPLIENCALNLECKVLQEIDLPANTFFIAEIINAYTEEKYLTDGKPDIKKINPMLLTMPDRYYWTVGEKVGSAWKDGGLYKTEELLN